MSPDSDFNTMWILDPPMPVALIPNIFPDDIGVHSVTTLKD
jgi:hypothetical protein